SARTPSTLPSCTYLPSVGARYIAPSWVLLSLPWYYLLPTPSGRRSGLVFTVPVICHPERSEGSGLDPSPASSLVRALNLAFIPASRSSGPERSAKKTHPGLGWFCTAPAPLLRHHLVCQLAHHHLAYPI